MALPSRSWARRISPGATLLAAVLGAASSARAQPAPVTPIAPPPAAAFAPAPPPYSNALPPPQLVAPRYEVPTYVYIPGDMSPGMPGMPDARGKRTWYGWQTLLVWGGSSVFALVAGISGGAANSPGVLITGLSVGGAGLLFGGPVVHWAHGNTGKGFGALGLNFGMPVVSSGLGVAIACAAGGCSGRGDGFGLFFGLMVGGSLGLVGSMIVDVTTLSYDSNVPVASTASRKSPTWTLLPDLKITREKTTFGVAGVF
jgi:hypothetical protein